MLGGKLLPRELSDCNRVGVTYMCSSQVVEINWAELKYVEENNSSECILCSHPRNTRKSDWKFFFVFTTNLEKKFPEKLWKSLLNSIFSVEVTQQN